MFKVSFQAKGFAPTKPIKLPKDVIGWPQPKEVPPFAKGGPKKVKIPDLAKTIMSKTKKSLPPEVLSGPKPIQVPKDACSAGKVLKNVFA